jgi:hypothetical protein
MHRLAPVALVALLLAAPASAQTKTTLVLVPDDALGFIIIKDLRQMSDKVARLAEKLHVAERISLLEILRRDIGIGEGLNERGSAVFIVLKGKKEKALPQVMVAVPVADYQKVARQLGAKPPKDGISEAATGLPSSRLAAVGRDDTLDGKAPRLPVLLANKGDYALIAHPEQRGALERVLHSRKSITSSLEPARDWLAGQDIAGVCTHQGVHVGLAMVLAGPGGAIESSTPGQHARLKETFAELEKNVRLIAFGARIEQEGHARLLTRVYVQPDGSYARWLAKAEPLRGNPLAQLPDQRYVLAAMAHISPQVSFEGLARILSDRLPPDQAKQLTADTVKLLQRVSEVGVVLYYKLAAKPGGERSAAPAGDIDAAAIAKVDDAPAFIEAAIALIKEAQKAARAAQKGTIELQFRQEQIAGKSAHLIVLRNQSALLLTPIDPQTVLACALSSADRAEQAVKQLAGTPAQALGTNALLHKTSALLPAQRQALAYLSIQPLWLLAFSPAGIREGPPLGFALSTFPAGVEAQFVIPFGTLEAVFERDPSSKGSNKKGPSQ